MRYNITVGPMIAIMRKVFLLSEIVTREGRSAAIRSILAIAYIGPTQTVPFALL